MTNTITTKLAEWEDAGLISHEQADAILTAEHPTPNADQQPGRIPLTLEIVGYLGAALALGAAFALSAEYWSDLATWAQVMLLGSIAVVLGLAGIAVQPPRDPAVGRMLSVLWAASVIAAGAATWIGTETGVDWDDEAVGLVTGLVAFAIAVPMLVAHQRPLQHVTVFVASSLTIVAGAGILFEFDGLWFGLGAVVFGLVWLAASLADRLPAASTGLVLGATTAIFGAQALSGETVGPWGELAGLAVAALLVAVGLRDHQKAMLGLGVVALFLFVPQTIFAVFGETAAALAALFVAGVALIAFAARRGRVLSLASQEEGPGAEQGGGGEEDQHEEQAGSIG